MNAFLIVIASTFLGVGLFVAWSLRFYFRAKKSPVQLFPEDLGLQKEEISIALPGRGSVHGWFIAHPSSKKTVVLAHGFAMNKGEILRRTFFLAKDYNLCYFDFLGAGESAGQTDVGYSEPADIASVIRFLKENKPQLTQDIALYGLSQGAGAAVRYAAEHTDISCVILEAVYFSFREIARRWIWKRKRVPYFPAVWGYLLFKEIKLRCKLDSLSPQYMAPRITMPALVIHGKEDKVSLPRNAERVYALLKGPKELWIVPNAGHTSCSKTAGAEYEEKVTQFLKKYF